MTVPAMAVLTMKGIRFSAALLAFAALGWAQPSEEAPADSCLECHLNLDDKLGAPARNFADDIHRASGFSCAACHGGDPASYDPEESMSGEKGFLGKIDRLDIPEMCARCHSDPVLMRKFDTRQRTDQLDHYKTSVHGQRLAKGDRRVAGCVDCHGVHGIRKVRHPLAPTYPKNLPATCSRCHSDAEYMKDYGIATDQMDLYRRSVHWQAVSERADLSAPTCATCHGNHAAAPPDVADVSHVCGTCHVVFENLFQDSPHQPVFEAMGLAACVTCHGNHEIAATTSEMLGTGEGSVCAGCHSEGDQGYQAAAEMKRHLDGLRRSLDESEAILDQAEQSGMEVSGGRLQWNLGHEQWVQARVNVHSFDVALVAEAAEEGLASSKAGHEAGVNALEERDYRRQGLAWALVTIVITMFGLWLAIRSLEARSEIPSPR